jgi:hypothetical protein
MTDTLQAMHPEAEDQLLERVLIGGDLSKLTPGQRVMYYRRTCESLGINYLTKPFDYLLLNGRLILYAKRDATDQLRQLRKVSITKITREIVDGILIVTASVVNGDGRTDEEVGCVPVAGLRGVDLANATMKAVTKAKRRATLSICGLGFLDESELDGVPDAAPVQVDPTNGETVTHTTGAPAIHPQTGEVTSPPLQGPVGTEAPKIPTEDKPVSLAQRKMLFALTKKAGLSEADLRSWLQLEFGTQHTSDLTSAQMRQLITHLKDATPSQLQDYLAMLAAQAEGAPNNAEDDPR